MANKRLHYGIMQVGFAPDGSTTFVEAHGVQSCGITTTFNLQQVFEMGQLEIYDNIENIPDIEVTMEKVLDGYCPLYLLATRGATASDIAGRSVAKSSVAMSLFPDTGSSANGTPNAQVTMSGMVISSVQYQFPVDGNFTESVTLVGNDKVWRTSAFTFSGAFTTNADTPASSAGSGGVNQRQHFLFKPSASAQTGTLDTNGQLVDGNVSVLPRNLPGISSSGINNKVGDEFLCKVQSVSVSTDFGREDLLNLGAKTPYFRFVTFPVEVTCEIEVLSLSGDMVSATNAGVFAGGTNLQNQTIRVATKEGLRLNLGTKNKLQSVSMNGGDTGGGNQSMTFSYSTFNSLDVKHWADVTTALAPAQGGVDN
jgi:hypothetical protein